MKRLVALLVVLVALGGCQKSDELNPEGGKDTETGDTSTTVVKLIPRKDIQLNDEEKGMTLAGNEFAFELFRKVASSGGEDNLCLSPYSVSLAVSMLNNGSAGTTREEILKALKLDAYPVESINRYYKQMVAAMTDVDPSVTMSFANSIWIQKAFPVLESFVNTNKEYFQAEIKNVDFSQPETLTQINQWCSDKTNEKIPEILDDLPASASLCLLNALYLKGPWADEFRKDYTAKETFTNTDGTKATVQMMNNTKSGGYFENEQLLMLELPLGNEAFGLLFVLPKEGTSLSSVIENLNGADWKNWLSEIRKSSHEVTVKLPRFKIKNEIGLNEILKDLGMKSMFGASADFSGVSKQPLLVSTVKQKTFLNVEEEGVEAAGVTIEIMLESNLGDVPVKKDFFVDRPFLYVIKEKSTGSILFIGKVDRME